LTAVPPACTHQGLLSPLGCRVMADADNAQLTSTQWITVRDAVTGALNAIDVRAPLLGHGRLTAGAAGQAGPQVQSPPCNAASILRVLPRVPELRLQLELEELYAVACTCRGLWDSLRHDDAWLRTGLAVLEAPHGEDASPPQGLGSAARPPPVASVQLRLMNLAAALTLMRRRWATVDTFQHYNPIFEACPPALPAQVLQVEAQLGFRLHPLLRAALLVRNGQPADLPAHRCIYGMRLLGAQELVPATADLRLWPSLVALGVAGIGRSAATTGARAGPISIQPHGEARPPAVQVASVAGGHTLRPDRLVPITPVATALRALAVDCSSGEVFMVQQLVITAASRNLAAYFLGAVT
jgi:cell wall assembly regulator SMI1